MFQHKFYRFVDNEIQKSYQTHTLSNRNSIFDTVSSSLLTSTFQSFRKTQNRLGKSKNSPPVGEKVEKLEEERKEKIMKNLRHIRKRREMNFRGNHVSDFDSSSILSSRNVSKIDQKSSELLHDSKANLSKIPETNFSNDIYKRARDYMDEVKRRKIREKQRIKKFLMSDAPMTLSKTMEVSYFPVLSKNLNNMEYLDKKYREEELRSVEKKYIEREIKKNPKNMMKIRKKARYLKERDERRVKRLKHISVFYDSLYKLSSTRDPSLDRSSANYQHKRNKWSSRERREKKMQKMSLSFDKRHPRMSSLPQNVENLRQMDFKERMKILVHSSINERKLKTKEFRNMIRRRQVSQRAPILRAV